MKSTICIDFDAPVEVEREILAVLEDMPGVSGLAVVDDGDLLSIRYSSEKYHLTLSFNKMGYSMVSLWPVDSRDNRRPAGDLKVGVEFNYDHVTIVRLITMLKAGLFDSDPSVIAMVFRNESGFHVN